MFYYTYTLEEDQTPRVVIKDVPDNMTEKEVKAKENRIGLIKVTRITCQNVESVKYKHINATGNCRSGKDTKKQQDIRAVNNWKLQSKIKDTKAKDLK